MSSNLVTDIKCVEGVDYNVVKHNAHFEWVTGFENTIKELAVDVFDTIGVKDENALNVVVKSLDGFQESLRTKMDQMVEMVNNIAGKNDGATTFATKWSDECKYQVDLRYHHQGDGPNAEKVRWGFESAIKYIVVCATTLANNDDSVEFKKNVSDFVKTVIIQSLIDSLQNVKSTLETSAKCAT